MTNQLRAAFYLLVRSAWVKGCAVLVVLFQLYRVWMFVEGARFGLQDALIVNGVTPMACCLLAVGLGMADQRSHGLRSAALAENGRRDYVASRFVAVAAASAGLVVLTIVLDLAASVVPGLSVLASSVEMNEPGRLLGHALTCVLFAEASLLFCLWLQRWTALVAALMVARGFLGLLVALPVLVLGNAFYIGASDPMDTVRLIDRICWYLPGGNFGNTVVSYSGQPNFLLLPLDPMALWVMPVVWTLVAYAIAQLVMARRAL